MNDNDEKHDSDPKRTDTSNGAADTRLMIVIAGLLVLICATLAFLWTIERTRRIRAERQVVELEQTLQNVARMSFAKPSINMPTSAPTTQQADEINR